MEFDSSLVDPRYLSAATDLYGRLDLLGTGDSVTHAYYHWSANRYDMAYPDYNVNVILQNGAWVPVYTTSVLLNATNPLRTGYAAHTYLRNSFAVGICVAAMLNATPSNFGDFPVQIHQLEMLCAAGAAICAKYDIDSTDPSLVMTHAEAAIADGYYVTDQPADGITRWDLARFADSNDPLTKAEAIASGGQLRALTHAYKLAILQALNLA